MSDQPGPQKDRATDDRDRHDGAEALGIDEVIEDPDAEAEGHADRERHWSDLNDEPGTTAMP